MLRCVLMSFNIPARNNRSSFESVLYISNTKLLFPEDQIIAEAIVEFSKEWNASVGITGALVFTERHFVQFIEGPTDAIADLLCKLSLDRRHSGMNIIERVAANQRQFEKWSLAYSGPDSFIDRELAPILQTGSSVAQHVTATKLRSLLLSMSDA